MNIKGAISNIVRKTIFITKKKSPEILTAGGIILFGVAIGATVKSTLEVKDTLAEDVEKVHSLHETLEDLTAIANDEVDIKATKKEIRRTYVVMGKKIMKLYLPTLITSTGSVACFLGSHHILQGRVSSLAAAYATLDTGYRNYRERVKEALGEEAEKDIYRGTKVEKDADKNSIRNDCVARQYTDDWSVFFDESNSNWNSRGILNLEWLLAKERYLNQILQVRGTMFLCEVYDELGIDLTTLGEEKLQGSHVVGWIYDPEDPTRDSYISFGLSDEKGNLTREAIDMRDNYERNFLIELNPDGDILTGRKDKKTFMKYVKC